MKPLKTLAWIAGVLLALAVVLVVAGSLLAARFAPGDDGPLAVHLTTVTTGDLTETFSAPGELEAITQVELSARVAARVTALPRGEGAAVSAGDVVVELDAKDLGASLDSATQRRDGLVATLAVDKARIRGQRAALESAHSALADAQRNLERQTQLQETGDVSQRLLEDARQARAAAAARLASDEAALQAAELGLDVSGFNIASAEADIRRLQDNLAYTTINSPIDGTVTRVNVEVGEIAVTGTMNNAGTVLLEIADLSGLVVIARIDETDINRIRTGQRAHVRVPAYPDQVFEGTVERVALSTAKTVTSGSGRGRTGGGNASHFETRIRLDELPDPVRTGLTATVEIEAETFTGVLKVPNQAVVSLPVADLPKIADGEDGPSAPGGGPDQPATYKVGGRTTGLAVYVVKNGKAALVPVAIGASDTDHTVITQGLEPGDAIISGPIASLSKLEKDGEVEVTQRDGETVEDVNSEP